MKNILFVCSQNRLRSPTAEEIFQSMPNIMVASAGTDKGAENPITPELLEWADVIFVMEPKHRDKLSKKFGSSLHHQRIICLNIPDNYEYMDPELIQILEAKVGKFLAKL